MTPVQSEIAKLERAVDALTRAANRNASAGASASIVQTCGTSFLIGGAVMAIAGLLAFIYTVNLASAYETALRALNERVSALESRKLPEDSK